MNKHADDIKGITTRKEQNWQSNVFGDPIVENKGRKRLEGPGAGTSGLFGEHKSDYAQSSKNEAIKHRKVVD
jgi:hypothetical protein